MEGCLQPLVCVARHLLEYVVGALPCALQHFVAVIGGVQPAQRGGDSAGDLLHQIAFRHAVATAREKQHRRVDGIQMIGALGGRLADGVQRERAENQPGDLEGMLHHRMGCHAPAEAVAAQQKRPFGLAAGVRQGCRDGGGGNRLAVYPRFARLLVGKVVAQRGEPYGRERVGDRLHVAMAHVGAGAVAEHQRAAMPALGGLQQRAHRAIAEGYALLAHQPGSSANELTTLPTSPYSTDSSTLIQ